MNNPFKTPQGKIVIGQFPNQPLWLAIFFYLLGFIKNDFLISVSFWGVAIAMLYWSYLELFYGVNNWRRFLGLSTGLYFLWKIVMVFIQLLV